MRTSKIVFVCAAVAALAMMGSAHAILVNYTVDGWGPTQFAGPVTPPANAPWGPNGYPGDTVELAAYSGTLDLTNGSYVLPINDLLWTIDYTYAGTATDPNAWSDLTFDFDALRNITIGGVSGTLSQPGHLEVTWDNDYLSFSDGPMLSLTVQGYLVEITPLALAEQGGTNFSGSNPWVQPERTMYAQFNVRQLPPVPEPASISLLGLGLAGLVIKRLRQRS